ncbi:hypothetical protein HMPREF2907_09040 [Neisseria sp. HMSC055H02]|nr:hypothetical protein HMPREF2907_09040 [Neisseria sp. HMSC055H02]
MKTYAFPFLSAVFLLAGCTAFSDDGTPSVHKGNDSILSFGKLGSATEDAPAGGWVMLGDQYTYVLDEGSSEKLSPIFKAKLKHPYEIKFAYSVKNIKKAGVTVWQEDRRFSTLLCLSYPHADKDEEKTLEKLAFTSSKGKKRHSGASTSTAKSINPPRLPVRVCRCTSISTSTPALPTKT